MNEEAILEAMNEIDKDKLYNYLLDSNELVELLTSIIEQDYAAIYKKCGILSCLSDARKYLMATDLAFSKELNSQVGRY